MKARSFWLGLLLAGSLLSWFTAQGADFYQTEFDLTENPISEGGMWSNGKVDGLDWNNVQSAFGRAYASVLSGNPNRYNDSVAHLKTSFAADQYAQGTVYRAAGYNPAPSKHEVELLLRFQITAHSARGYEVMWGVSGYLAVVRWNGPLANYTALYDSGDPGIGPAVDGDVLRAEIKGNIIKVYKNGTLKASVDITSSGGTVWTTGQPGVGFWPVDGASLEKYGWKNFQSGSLTANRPPVIGTFSPASPATAVAGTTQPFSVSAQDPDGDPLSYAWKLDGINMTVTINTFNYSPVSADAGSHSIAVTVTDGKGGSVSQTWNVTVTRKGGLRDFNGDGKADILLRHSSTGDVRLWIMK